MDNPIRDPLDAIPALVATFRRAVIGMADGRFSEPPAEAALSIAAGTPHLTAHTGMTLQRLGWQRNDPRGVHYDVLELFAFVRPAQPIAPSVGALARAMSMEVPQSLAEQASVPALDRDFAAQFAHGVEDRSNPQASLLSVCNMITERQLLDQVAPAP